jgi:hypothetical protein
MSVFKKFVIVLAAAITALGVAKAQTAQSSATTVFIAENLGKTPGVVVVSPSFETVIEFFSDVESASISNSNLFGKPDLDGRFLYLNAAVSSGSPTSLLAKVNGQVYPFKLVIQAGTSPRIYKVIDSRASDVARPAPAPVAPSTTPTIAQTSSTQTNPATLISNTVTTTPSVPTATTNVSSGINPEFLQMQVIPRLVGDSIQLEYVMLNKGEARLLLNVNNLRVTSNGTSIPITVYRSEIRTSLKTGEKDNGIIVLAKPTNTNLVLEWTLVDDNYRARFILSTPINLTPLLNTSAFAPLTTPFIALNSSVCAA